MKKILLIIVALVGMIPAAAVTDKEMDQARAIATKHYLRWANNASGYLDEIQPKSMAELNAKLKAKEQENVKAFNAVKVPAASEYAKWDKEKLAEFWGVTAYQTPGLLAEGKGGRLKARKEILAMTVSAPTATPVEEKKTPETPDASSEEVGDTIIGATGDPQPDNDQLLNDQKQIEKDAEEAAANMSQPEQNHTWVYILVLAILVAVVIWLVVYAANLMKRQPGASEDEETADLREQARKALAKRKEEVEELHRRLEAEENRSATLGAEIEKLKLENKRKDDRIAALREENAMLRHDAEQRQAAQQSRRQEEAEQPRRQAPAEQPQRRQQAAEQPRRHEEPAKQILKVIYLGRANARGIFVRADRKINPGNTIYRLDTNDGLVGTFHVVDEPEVVDVAISNPGEYLAHGCTGENLDDTLGVTRIVTESAGTAIFENGYWKVLRKTKVKYE